MVPPWGPLVPPGARAGTGAKAPRRHLEVIHVSNLFR